MKTTIKCLIAVIVISVVGSTVFFLALRVGKEPRQPFCHIAPLYLAKMGQTDIVEAQVEQSKSNRPYHRTCQYELTVTKALFEKFSGLRPTFSIDALQWGEICEPAGKHVIVIVDKDAVGKDAMSCDDAAVVKPSEEISIRSFINNLRKVQ